MKHLRKTLFMLIISLVTMFSLNIIAFASDDEDLITGNGYTSAKDVFTTYGPGTEHEDSKVTGYLMSEFNGEKGYSECISINGEDWWYNPEDEEEIIELGDRLDRKVLYAKNDEDSLRRFNDSTNDQTVTADSETSRFILSGFLNVVTIVLGFIVVAISVGITITTALDVAFIVLPIFRAEISGMKILQAKDGSNKIRIISDDAQYAVMATDTVRSDENPLVIYFKSRIFTYMVLAILLYILITGKVTVIAQLAMKLVSGVLNVLGQVG